MPQTRQRTTRGKRDKIQGNSKGSGSSGISTAKKEILEAEEDSMNGSSIVAALRRQPVWIVLAVSSGACAAFNGVFAKLYVYTLTHTYLPPA